MAAVNLNKDAINICVGVFKRLQTSKELSDKEKQALHTLGLVLAPHLLAPHGSSSYAATEEDGCREIEQQDEEEKEIVEAFSVQARPSVTAQRELLLRRHSKRPGLLESRSSEAGLRSSLSEDPRVADMLSQLPSWDNFDVFQLTTLTQRHPLEAVSLALLQQLQLIEELQLPVDLLHIELDCQLHKQACIHYSIAALDCCFKQCCKQQQQFYDCAVPALLFHTAVFALDGAMQQQAEQQHLSGAG